ncbi:nucleoside-triphosphatase [Reticulomyxa filosa]|uniref:Nucleoside-triphosphatase n=1 Tax=Reticulomyxa filosa TaxID=46433 RepID=X6LQS7_RETFI|nr:nucleoside-triphosphatase [Reticulomyxa filosa]|eukprot:ETO04238.1 nucleoside-triphosphatase [Reticulomyxa filosa]
MELFSKQFERKVQELIDDPTTLIIATIPNKHVLSLVEKIKVRTDSKVYELTTANRERLRPQIAEDVCHLIDTFHHSSKESSILSKESDSQYLHDAQHASKQLSQRMTAPSSSHSHYQTNRENKPVWRVKAAASTSPENNALGENNQQK